MIETFIRESIEDYYSEIADKKYAFIDPNILRSNVIEIIEKGGSLDKHLVRLEEFPMMKSKKAKDFFGDNSKEAMEYFSFFFNNLSTWIFGEQGEESKKRLILKKNSDAIKDLIIHHESVIRGCKNNPNPKATRRYSNLLNSSNHVLNHFLQNSEVIDYSSDSNYRLVLGNLEDLIFPSWEGYTKEFFKKFYKPNLITENQPYSQEKILEEMIRVWRSRVNYYIDNIYANPFLINSFLKNADKDPGLWKEFFKKAESTNNNFLGHAIYYSKKISDRVFIYTSNRYNLNAVEKVSYSRENLDLKGCVTVVLMNFNKEKHQVLKLRRSTDYFID
jgi:hypothetical protein